jgi:hypothetical protein
VISASDRAGSEDIHESAHQATSSQGPGKRVIRHDRANGERKDDPADA